MKKRLLTFSLGLSLVAILSTNLCAEEEGKPLDQVPAIVEHTPYTTTRVSSATTLKKLALKYYGDENDYKIIQKANKGLGMKVPRNTEVNIPITKKFKDQPEQLDWKR